MTNVLDIGQVAITPSKAKSIIRGAISRLGIGTIYKLSAKTISFSDLGRGSRIFVKIQNPSNGLPLSVIWRQLEAVARVNGFSIE